MKAYIGAGSLLLMLSSVACGEEPAALRAHYARQAARAAGHPPTTSPAEPASPPAGGTTTTGAVLAGGAAKADEPSPIPADCVADGTLKGTPLCVPERIYAKKLCGASYPEVALSLFRKGTPFTRAYLAGDANRTKPSFDEEVIVVARNGGPPGAIATADAQVSYDVLRWNGTCASAKDGALSMKRPAAPKPASVVWGRIEDTTTRDALLELPKVKASHAQLEKACASSTNPKTSPKACEDAEKAFTKVVVESVRAGAQLPSPAHRP